MIEIDRKALAEGAAEYGFVLTPRMLDQFALYASLLSTRNETMNLTTVPVDEYVSRHFVDSLSFGRKFLDDAQTLLDVGSGAGAPGIPCAIAAPNLQVTLLEATGKRVKFLEEALAALELASSSVAIQGRAEALAHEPEYRERFDRVVARAVARMSTLVELTVPFAKVGGQIGLLKGHEVQAEIEESRSILGQLGGVPGDQRALGVGKNLIIVEKKRPTPADRPLSYTRLKQREARLLTTP